MDRQRIRQVANESCSSIPDGRVNTTDGLGGRLVRGLPSSKCPVLLLCLALPLALAACPGNGHVHSPVVPPEPTPIPTPTPTPPVTGTIRFVSASLAPGSTVAVSPMGAGGQQAQQLSFTAAIRLDHAVTGTLVRAWVRTDEKRCMGGGRTSVDFSAGVEREVSPASMSSGGACTLPYTTPLVEFEVIDATGTQVLTQSFPASYSFVAAQ